MSLPIKAVKALIEISPHVAYGTVAFGATVGTERYLNQKEYNMCAICVFTKRNITKITVFCAKKNILKLISLAFILLSENSGFLFI